MGTAVAEGINKREQSALIKLFAELRTIQAREYQLTEEIQRILGGGEPIGLLLARLEDGYDRLWCGRYAPTETKRYVWDFARDRLALKRLIKSLTEVEIIARMGRFLASDEPFYSSKRHPFALFVNSVNSWAAKADAPEFNLETAPADCKHVPKCVSDVAHTKRRSAEMRG